MTCMEHISSRTYLVDVTDPWHQANHVGAAWVHWEANGSGEIHLPQPKSWESCKEGDSCCWCVFGADKREGYIREEKVSKGEIEKKERKRRRKRRRKIPLMVATRFCLQCPRAAHALGLDQNEKIPNVSIPIPISISNTIFKHSWTFGWKFQPHIC